MKKPSIAGHSSRRYSSIAILVSCAAVVFGLIPAQGGDNPAPITIRGSSTLEPLAESWTAEFQKSVQAHSFDIETSGTSEGIEDLLAGRADIAMASRPLSEDEETAAHENGLSITATVVARMGIAVVVNGKNPVSSVSVDDLAGIFSGEVRNWQRVGGPDEAITVVRKESGWSPDFFRRRIMGDKNFVTEAVIVDSKEEVVAEVADRPWSIGVTGMPEAIPALDRLSLLRLVSKSSDEDSTYALSRPLFFFTVEGSPSVGPFLEFVVSAEAQHLIEATGFYPAVQKDAMASESQ